MIDPVRTPDTTDLNEFGMGWVSISRSTPGDGEEYINLTIRTLDQDIRADVSLADFALTVTGRGRTPARVRIRPLGGRAGGNGG